MRTQSRNSRTPVTFAETDLAGLGVDISFREKLLHNSHLLITFHSGEGGQHDGRVSRFVLLIDVTHP